MKKLKLTSNKEIWTINTLHGTQWDDDPRMVGVRDKILQRDNHTCQCCGWKSDKYQEIHHIDGNHNNFNEKNLVTVCPLCHQVYHLPTAGVLKGGYIIWCPEISQEQLNNLCANLFVVMEDGFRQKDLMQSLYTDLERRKEIVDNNLGNLIGASDPSVLAEALIEIGKDKSVEKIVEDNLRLLPTRTRFKTQIEYWASQRNIEDKENNFLANFIKKFRETDKYNEMLPEVNGMFERVKGKRDRNDPFSD